MGWYSLCSSWCLHKRHPWARNAFAKPPINSKCFFIAHNLAYVSLFPYATNNVRQPQAHPGQFNLTTYFSIHPIFIRRAFTVLCEHPKAFATARNDFVLLYSAKIVSSANLSLWAGGLMHLRPSSCKSCSLWRLSISWMFNLSTFLFPP